MATSIRAGSTRRFQVTIPAGQTVDVETIAYAQFSTTKYLISYYNEAEGVTKAVELFASKLDTNINSNLYSKIGNEVDVETNILVETTEVILRVVNNESFDLLASVSKILV